MYLLSWNVYSYCHNVSSWSMKTLIWILAEAFYLLVYLIHSGKKSCFHFIFLILANFYTVILCYWEFFIIVFLKCVFVFSICYYSIEATDFTFSGWSSSLRLLTGPPSLNRFVLFFFNCTLVCILSLAVQEMLIGSLG